MQDVTVTGRSATLCVGTLRLTKQQASARAANLRALEGDLYAIRTPVEFKHGERFGYDGDLSKALAALLDGGHRPPPRDQVGATARKRTKPAGAAPSVPDAPAAPPGNAE